MSKIISLLLMIFVSGLIPAQNPHWEYTNFPFVGIFHFSFAYDPVNELSYVGGRLYHPDSLSHASLISYDGENWSMIGRFEGHIHALAYYQEYLYVGGKFSDSLGSFDYNYLKRYNGFTWENVGAFSDRISTLKVVDDTLYVGGFFTETDSFPYGNSVVKFDGENFYSIGNNPFEGDEQIESIEKYQGDLFIGGNFNVNGIRDLIMYRNGEWQQVGQGFTGFATRVKFLDNFQGELYAAGVINQDEGNAGNYIQKWNGEIWTDVGTGLNGEFTGQIELMEKHEDNLYISGKVDYAGENAVNGLAKWDGTNWCGFFSEGEQGGSEGFFFHGDELYVFFHEIIGHPFFQGFEFYKWLGGDDYQYCEYVASNEELRIPNDKFIITPNPVNESTSFYNKIDISGKISISDISGKIITAGKEILPRQEIQINLSNLPSGMYIIRVEYENGILATEKIVKL